MLGVVKNCNIIRNNTFLELPIKSEKIYRNMSGEPNMPYNYSYIRSYIRIDDVEHIFSGNTRVGKESEILTGNILELYFETIFLREITFIFLVTMELILKITLLWLKCIGQVQRWTLYYGK